MTTHIIEPLAAIGSMSVVGAGLLQAVTPAGAQEWTVLGLLAFVVAGIGTWIVRSIDRTTVAIEGNTKAQAEVAVALALLMQKTTDAQHDGEEKRRQILAEITSIPSRVAERIQKPA